MRDHAGAAESTGVGGTGSRVPAPATVGLGRVREAMLMAAGFTTVVPLMKFTVTGFSMLCFLLVLLFSARLDNRRAGAPLLLAFAGSVAYVISSIVNATPLLAPNVPAFAAYGLYLCGLLVLVSDLDELFALMVGVSVGTIGFYAVLGTALTADGVLAALWKYGFAPAVTLLVLYAIARSPRHRPMAACAALVILAAVSVALNFRSHALICLCAALLVFVDRLRRRPTSLPVKVVTVAVIGAAVAKGLEYAAREGLLGSALTDKVEMQSTQHVPSILVGRTEPPLSISAIIDHPLLGWGYANNISSGVIDHAYQLAVSIGFDASYPFRYIWFLPDGSVSLHSILLGSWAEGGVFAVLLPLWLVWACLTLIRFAHRHPAWTAALTFLGIQGIWDLVFSPWSYNLPVVYAAISVAALFITTGNLDRPVRRTLSAPPLGGRRSRPTRPPSPPAQGGAPSGRIPETGPGERRRRGGRRGDAFPLVGEPDSLARAPGGGRRRRDSVGPPTKHVPRHAAPERTAR
ncbi:O-antigen ligase family protein [Williamsia maris]|uniref:O-antigen ligase n=1 Tax=Williamsia maris TaxID=72806 RepID=A0ABT1HIS7_9NOCA|nr:O-antigen ligase family protein [Williamsia maris]MCP2177832.1 O-antigen ligase [Williamsia maris]